MGAKKREARLLRYSIVSWAMAVGVSLVFPFYLISCGKTVSQKASPSLEPTALIASEVKPGSFAESSQPIITVHYPADLAVMEFHLLSISLSLPEGSADFIEVEVNSHIKASVVPHRNFACLSVPLEIGINEIHIRAKKEDRILDEVALHVFRRSDLVGNYEKPPAGFRKDYFHMQAHPLCATCHHVLEPTEADKEIIPIETYAAEGLQDKAVEPSESSCYSCHWRITSFATVHGPMFVWSCLSCHDSQAEPKYSVRYPVPELCYTCHVAQKQKRSGKKSYHAPYITNKCGICHNPHASDNPFRLDKPIWLLCVSCHPNQADGRHVVAPYFWGTRHRRHPTHGVPDPSRKGHELTCASCHDAHASDSPNFITKYDTMNFDLCIKCHMRNKP